MTIGIIGGGAAGLMAALTAAEGEGHPDIFILEHNARAGKKLLSTGNGRCNLTNEQMGAAYYRSEQMDAVRAVLAQFGFRDTLRFFGELGLMTKARNGYVYPRSAQASEVLRLLLAEASRRGIDIRTGVHVTGLKREKEGFRILTDGGEAFADRVILAAGGKAAKALGSDGSGYDLARSMGHTIETVVPSLVQLKIRRHPLAGAAGVRTDARVAVLADGREAASDTGELQITGYGVSGIPVFQVSRFAAKALAAGKTAEVSLDLMHEMEEEEFCRFLMERKRGRGDLTAAEYMTGLFHGKLTPELLRMAGISGKTRLTALTEKEIRRLAHLCKDVRLIVEDTNGFENAQVCAGGVRLDEIDCDTMESRIVPGLYLAGELLDADGMCGGYNLQWAWATGHIAGRCAAGYDGRRERL